MNIQIDINLFDKIAKVKLPDMNKILIEAKGNQSIIIKPGQDIRLGFEHSTVSFERDGNNLVLSFEDGSQITLAGFFVGGLDGTLPSLELADGSVVETAVFLQSLDPDFDVSPAAETAQSDGLSSYQDAAGELLDGLDGSGSLDGPAARVESLQGSDVAPVSGSLSSSADSNRGDIVNPENPGGGENPVPGPGPAPNPEPGPDPDPTPNPEPDPGPEPDPTPEPPTLYYKAALLGADGSDSPAVKLFLLDGEGNRLTAPYPENIGIEGNEHYNVVYDGATGTIHISLKDPASGMAPTDNITIVVNGKSYVVQVGSSEGNDLADVAWSPVDDDLSFGDITWAGSTSDHMDGNSPYVTGHSTGANITTPEGYENTELHLQLTDSSLTSRGDTGVPGAESASVELNLDNGSFSISNEGHALFEVSHSDPKDPNYYWSSEEYDTSSTNYDATVAATVAAKGQEAHTGITVNGGDVSISFETASPDTGSHEVANVSGIYAAEGGDVNIAGRDISVNASSGGFAHADSAKSASVSGIRSDGAIINEVLPPGETWPINVPNHSEVNLYAQGDISIRTEFTGDTDAQDHSGISYAGVAATERGKVDIEAGGDVDIEVENKTHGGELNTSGIFGIFSGYGFGERDMASIKDFAVDENSQPWADQNEDGYDEDTYSYYLNSISYGYYSSKRSDQWDDETGTYKQKNEQTKVSIEADGDVNVKVDLGGQDYTGTASGISARMGDVDIKSGGDINVSTVHNGNHSGDQDHGLSAMELSDARVFLTAEGDINLHVESNDDNVSVVNYYHSTSQPYFYGIDATHLSAANVNLTGKVGANGGPDNSIIGLDATGTNFKKEAFTVHADEKFTIDVTAQHNGGETSSTGIAASTSDVYRNDYQHYFGVGTDAPVFEINASVTGNIDLGNSYATGISVSNGGSLGISSYSSLKEFQTPDYVIREWDARKPVEEVRINAEGARHNTGIEVKSNNSTWSDRTRLDLRADELNINVKGGTSVGESSSYGIKAVSLQDNQEFPSDDYGSRINIQTSDLTINVDNPQLSVGVGAIGWGSFVTIGSVVQNDESGSASHSAIRVEINCTVTNAGEQLRGIAIEALDGGNVTIRSNESFAGGPGMNDSIIINGDIVASNTPNEFGSYNGTSRIDFYTAYGDDRVEINGDVKLGKGSDFTINLGEGNDHLSIAGGINLETGAYMYVEAGDGDDVIKLNGPVDLSYYQENGQTHAGGNLYVNAGSGNDVLILEAPDAETFNQWYKDWLTSGDQLANMEVENIVVKGVDNPDDLAWFSEMVSQHGNINMQFQGQDSSFSVINDFGGLADGFNLDGIGDNDTLQLLYQGQDTLDSLHSHLADGSINGLEHLIVDLTGSQSLDDLLSSGGLDSLLGGVGNDANLMLKVGSLEGSGLEAAGWSSTGQTENINGIDYSIYTNTDLGQQIYLQIATSV